MKVSTPRLGGAFLLSVSCAEIGFDYLGTSGGEYTQRSICPDVMK